jgi:sortase A
MRGVLRFLASVLITSGLLMLVDAGLSVAWQEPVSAFMASREQDKLASRLNKLDAAAAADLRSVGSPGTDRRALARLARLQRRRTHTGDPIGRIVMPTLKRRTVVVQGTDTSSLRKGPGHYPKTSFPGEGGTVAVAGHRTTYGAPFRTVDQLKHGDEIVMEMPYGRFTYAVERTQIVSPSATEVVRRVPGRERLVLSACHPLYSASQRIIVFARLVTEEAR